MDIVKVSKIRLEVSLEGRPTTIKTSLFKKIARGKKHKLDGHTMVLQKVCTVKAGNKIHRINLPRVVVVGEGTLTQIGEICKEFGFRSALLVSGTTTWKVAGEKVNDLLVEAGVRVETVRVSSATREAVETVKTQVKATPVDVLLGIGGGRNIDVAKVASLETNRFFISIPTVASHDGIASNLASIKSMGKPYSVPAASPVAVVMDSKIIQESPYRFTAAGCGDVICKAVEVRDWRLAHSVTNEYYGGYAGSLSLMSSQHVMDNAHIIRERSQEGVRILLEALVSCGVAMSIAGSSRPTSGSSHLFSHALDQLAEKPALHGEQCGVGSIMMAKLHNMDWERIRDSLKTLGAPTTAKELGIPPETVVEALCRARHIRPTRYTILNQVEMNKEKARELAESTGVI